MWRRVQGEGTVYTMTSTMAKWAEMDKINDPAGKECRMDVVNLIMPHVKSVNYNIARSIPKVSRSTPFPENTKLVWVYNVKTTNAKAFMDVVKEIENTIKKSERDTDALKAKFRSSVSNDWSYIYTLNKELSN